MNQQQKQYALKRIGSIEYKLVYKAEKKYTKPAKHLNDRQKINLIKAGKVPVMPFKSALSKITFHPYSTNNISHSPSILNMCDFSGYENDEKIDPRLVLTKERIALEADTVKDKIMLGDEEAALKAIAGFKSFKI